MSKGIVLDSTDLEYVAEMLNAVFSARHQLGPLSQETLQELANALPRAEEALRACAESMN